MLFLTDVRDEFAFGDFIFACGIIAWIIRMVCDIRTVIDFGFRRVIFNLKYLDLFTPHRIEQRRACATEYPTCF